MKFLFTLLTVSLFASHSLGSTFGLHENYFKANEEECKAWVDSVYDSMTERQRIGQLFFPKARPTDGESSKAQLRRFVSKYEVGGLLFTGCSLEQQVEMTNYAQSLSKVPLLMTFDGEWGLAMRIDRVPRFPYNMAVGAIRDERLLYEYGYEVGRQCRLIGVHVNFAPTVDVNSNPRNPVIGNRSFGEDPERVARLGAAYALGLEDAGTQAVPKHFPGHGDTSTDSHDVTTVLNHSVEHLDSVELLPFKRLVENGVSGIMAAHLVVPALDPSRMPSSLSKPMITDLLRKKWGFDGIVYTDALAMKGANVEGKNSTLLALQAGCDALIPTDVTELDVIYNAVKQGKVSWATIEEHCKRILRYKYILGLPKEKPVEIEGLYDKLRTPQCTDLMERIANATMTALWNKDNILPLKNLDTKRIVVVNIGAKNDNEFVKTAKQYSDSVDVFYATSGVLNQNALNRIANHDVVIAVIHNDSHTSRKNYANLAKMDNLVSVFLISPYKMDKFNQYLHSSKALILGYETLPELQTAAAKAVFGAINVDGSLPVNLPNIAPLGAGLRLKKIPVF